MSQHAMPIVWYIWNIPLPTLHRTEKSITVEYSTARGTKTGAEALPLQAGPALLC